MSFIVVPDNVTVGAAKDYMGLLTTDTPATPKNYQSDYHTLGVELDTSWNPEFNDPNANHIGVNLAIMNSTYTVTPIYYLASFRKDSHLQIWIDYFKPDAQIYIYYAHYRQAKPTTPQGSLTGENLLLLLENMYIGFSTAKGIRSVPHACAWSFNNDGGSAPPIVIGLNATSTSPPLDKKRKRLNLEAILGIMVSASIIGICLLCLICRCILLGCKRHTSKSHTSGANGFVINSSMLLKKIKKSLLKSHIKISHYQDKFWRGISLATQVIKELATVEVGFVSVMLLVSLISLISDKKSIFFLFFLFILVPRYLFALCETNPLNFYFVKSLFCPICIKIFGFYKLYKSRSSFRWCDEFRKKKIVNPSHIWIDENYAHTCPHAASCLDVCEFIELPNSPPNIQSFTVSCQGCPAGILTIRKKQHDYILKVMFDSVRPIEGANCYINVTLAFFENNNFLGDHKYRAIDVRRVHLVEKLFHCYSDPSFGGYVEKICPTGPFSTTFVAHCPRFIDTCHKICFSDSIPKLVVASRTLGSEFIVGVPFWRSELLF